MNLIKQLGGYEQGKAYAVDANACGAFDDENKIKSSLLEYRRENGIFEVGDVVAEPNLIYPYLYKIYKISGLLIKVDNLTTGRKSISFESDIRHATNEEIEAGHRL